MSKFVMKNRPKKPTEPKSIQYEVGDRVSLAYLLECVEKFKTENPGLIEEAIHLELEQNWFEGWYLFLTAPPESYTQYENKLLEYRADLKAYKDWQKKNKRQIEKHKAENKIETAKRKLERTQTRLYKEIAEVEAKMGKT